jgi:hypothetical protein
MHCNTNYIPINNYNIGNVFPQQTLNQYEGNDNNYYTNNNEEIFSNNNNEEIISNSNNEEIFSNQDNSNNFNDNDIIIDTPLITCNELNNSINNELSLDNYNQAYVEEEPKSNFKLSDFIILNKIGEGAEGSIFTVKWKKNDKIYVIKKCEIIFDEDAKKR